MKLVLRRDQKKSLTGTITFTIDVRAELIEEEAELVRRYKMGKTVVFETAKGQQFGGMAAHALDDMTGGATTGSGLIGMGIRFARRALAMTVTVDDLVKGKTIDCKDITEIIAAEDQIKNACGALKELLIVAKKFGGEEVVQY